MKELFFTSLFLSLGWYIGKRLADIVATQIDLHWHSVVGFPGKIVPFIKDIWYWKIRRKKLIKTIRENKDDKAMWALAERLKHLRKDTSGF